MIFLENRKTTKNHKVNENIEMSKFSEKLILQYGYFQFC